MAFIRLSDSYIDHPKFVALSASAFRLWHEGMAYCRRHQTDGGIPTSALTGFRHFQPARVKELTAVVLGEGGPLWEIVPGGYQVRNYLKWNLSRDEDAKQKQDSKRRTAEWRKNRFAEAVTSATGDASPNELPHASRDALVPSQIRSDQDLSSERRTASNLIVSDGLAQRAADFLNKYAELYTKHRHGARNPRLRPALDHVDAIELCRTWDDERLQKLAEILLTTDDEWVSGTDRGFRVFVSKAGWCDERLAAWEAKRRPA